MFLLSLIFWFLLIIFSAIIIPGVFFRGAPYVPTHPRALEHMLGFAALKSGDKAVDIGSGDGRIVMALARAGVEAHGYEINPFLVALSRYRIRRAGLQARAFVHWKNFWNEDFSQYNIVTLYGITGMMPRLATKLQKELPAGARVVSNLFVFPNWPLTDSLDGVLLYIK